MVVVVIFINSNSRLDGGGVIVHACRYGDSNNGDGSDGADGSDGTSNRGSPP